MKLPVLKYKGRSKATYQMKFGGLNHVLGAKGGDIFDMRNMWSEYFPVLSTRPRRMLYKSLLNGNGLYCWKELCWISDNKFFFGGIEKGTVSPGEKNFAALGEIIVILPDKKYYDTSRDKFGSLEASWSGTGVEFKSGTIFEVEATGNTINVEGANWEDFKPGDAVDISGCTTQAGNNKTVIIREIKGSQLVFDENAFILNGPEHKDNYTEPGTVTIKRSVPDIKFLCENENRLWGCDNTTIYACKQGDPFNWNVFDGLNTDSYAVKTGSPGYFTGCISYAGYPIFFKEDHIYKVYGSLPSNFEVMGNATLGLSPGSEKSLAVAGETLFYLSTSGIMAYAGGIPQPIGSRLGVSRMLNAVGGSDGLKYYVSAESDGKRLLHVYDTQRRVWHTEDETDVKGFAMYNGNLYYMDAEGKIWITGKIQNPPPEAVLEEPVKWWVEFADFTEDSPNKKRLKRLLIRLDLEMGAEVNAYMLFDSTSSMPYAPPSEGGWINVGGVKGGLLDQIPWAGEEPYPNNGTSGQPYENKNDNVKLKTYYLPIVPRRADHYKLRLEGTGECQVYSISREYYTGSAL